MNSGAGFGDFFEELGIKSSFRSQLNLVFRRKYCWLDKHVKLYTEAQPVLGVPSTVAMRQSLKVGNSFLCFLRKSNSSYNKTQIWRRLYTGRYIWGIVN